jgi:hypothetical protein
MSSLHALLIGVDCYLPNRLPDGSRYESLSGSVRDVERVESFLGGLKPQRILKLTASRGTDGQPKEPREILPTYENIIAAFRELGQGAAPGDQVYIHYSGHGGRTETLFPEIRGEKGYDEALVPCDIGDPQARYLRGPELADLIQKLVEKQLIVNVVLDCCHSAGMRRSPAKAMRRGLEVIDTTPRPTDSLVASREDLLGLLRRQQAAAPARRNITLETPWLIAPKGFVLLAACRPQDCAFEYPFENGESQGALTYYLLKELREEGAGRTFKELHERVYAQVYDQFKYQTPMLAGESDRPFFSTRPGLTRATADSSPQGVIVLAVDADRVLLNTGQAQGARKGMRFAIHHPAREIGTSGGDRPQAVVEIQEEGGATESWAKIIETTRSLIRPGAQVVPLGLAPDMKKFQGVVKIAAEGADQVVLERVRAAVVKDESYYLRLAGEGDPADFQVTLDGSRTFEVLDAKGLQLQYLGPPLTTDGPDSISDLLQRLIHLTRYRNVLRIKNADDQSPESLAGKIRLNVLGTQKDFTPGDDPEPQPVGPPPVELQIGEWLFLEIANKSSRILNFAVLDLQPDWGISQVFPSGRDVSFWPLDPGEAKVVRIKAFLPDNFKQGADIIKVFATMGAATYRWMLLPALDTPGRKRHMAVSSFASEEWTAEQLEVRVRR